jgi:hypothetical protein
MFNTLVGAGAATRYGFDSGSGSDQKMRILAAPAPQHWILQIFVWLCTENSIWTHVKCSDYVKYIFASLITLLVQFSRICSVQMFAARLHKQHVHRPTKKIQNKNNWPALEQSKGPGFYKIFAPYFVNKDSNSARKVPVVKMTKLATSLMIHLHLHKESYFTALKKRTIKNTKILLL